MPRDYLNQSPTTMRRSDRAVEDPAWMVQFLHQAALGTLATLHGGQAFINTNLFVYDESKHKIYLHTSHIGRTRSNIDAHNRVCFSIMEMGRLLPAAEALEFSVEYAGVTIFGTVDVIEDEAEATAALQMLLDKYAPHLAPGSDYRPPVPEELKRTAVFQLNIEDWSGKKKEVAAFPGAYWYPEQPVLASVQQRPRWQGRLQAIHIAAGKRAALQSPIHVEAVAGRGLKGDRYFGAEAGADESREVTLIAQEDLEAVQAQYAFPIKHEQTRRNLLTQGVPLSHLVGKRFRIGQAVLEGVELCEPCKGFAAFSGYGNPVISAMLHRAGLRAAIIHSGTIQVGDTIQPVIEPE